ncbi:MAG: ABC transporter ATP-binding protein [Ignavibacteria bacterium]|nr:ABC transporter ATP-binding protein [Ignavibacteria bacterium]
MDNKLLLDIKDIKKSYRISKEKNLEVLKGINLQINREEIVAIVGKSGAGKSTLLHLIGTLDNPDSGKIFFDGTDVYAMKEKELSKFRNSKIGFIFQFHHLLPEFTAIENVMIPSMIEGKEDRAKAENLLKEVGIEERINHRPNEISGGEAQRIAIARALINSPDLILADEPTGNLDTHNADAVMNLIFSLRDKFKQTFIIVTHNEEFALRCDRVIRMNDGLIV